MPKKIDLTNQTFSKLHVLSESKERIVTPNGRSHVTWLCECECGNQLLVRGDLLRNHHIVSCGCQKKEILKQAGINRKIDLTNKVFGYLTVLEDSGQRTNSGEVIWKCQCECGNICYVSSNNLTRKKEGTISCGCKKSRGEKKIIDILLENQILFISQKKFDTCIFPKTNRHLIFDFYLPEYNTVIEYGGEQHFHELKNDIFSFREIQERDNFKNQWCNQNNIQIIRIPYTDFDKIDINYIMKKIKEEID